VEYTLDELLARLSESDETVEIEAKTGADVGPSAMETVSAFSNEPRRGGGYIVFGVRETDTVDPDAPRFEVVGVTDPDRLTNEFVTKCSDETLNHPVRPDIETMIDRTARRAVVVAFVPEAQESAKPVYLRRLGLPRGAFRRISGHDVRCNDDDLAALFHHRGTATYDDTVVDELTFDDLDVGAFAAYRKMRAQLDPGARELNFDDRELARAIGAAKISRSRELVPTIAGLVVLGKYAALRRVAPLFRIDYIRLSGTQWIDDPEQRGETIEILDPLLIAIPRVVQNVLSDIPKATRIQTNGIEREELPVVPALAVREAVVNAVMHRSYRTRQPIQIIRYADRIEIRNPGASLVPDERLGEPGSVNRNEKIAMILHETRLAENKGSGIRAMRAALERAGVVPPVFHSDRARDEFVATFRLQAFLNDHDLVWLARFKGYGLSEEQQKALVLIRRNGSITNSEYRRINHVDTLTATAQLRQLRELAIVELIGTGANRTYLPGSSFERPGSGAKTVRAARPVAADRESLLGALPRSLRERVETLRKPTTRAEVDALVLELIRYESFATRQLAALLQRSKQGIQQSISRLVAAGLVEMSRPQEPSHPFQSYVPTPLALNAEQPSLFEVVDGSS
jgi:ATP-dependent DNA helicase RecG